MRRREDTDTLSPIDTFGEVIEVGAVDEADASVLKIKSARESFFDRVQHWSRCSPLRGRGSDDQIKRLW
jgi:hypothetical protein